MTKVLYGTQNKIRIKGMVHYGENDQKVNYDADGTGGCGGRSE